MIRRQRLLSVLVACFLLASLQAEARRRAPGDRQFGVEQVLDLGDREKAGLPREVKDACIREFGLQRVALRRDFVRAHHKDYAVEVPREQVREHIQDQNRTGLCWVFATTNVLESRVARQRGGQAPGLSEGFVQYHAWRSMARSLLQRVSRGRAPENIGNGSDFSEGGEFPWAMQLVNRYGLVPRAVMPLTADGRDPDLVINKLRGIMVAAQESFREPGPPKDAAQRQALVQRYTAEVDQLLDATFGAPPEQFEVDGQVFTPKSWARHLLGEREDYVVLDNDPTQEWNTCSRTGSCLGLKGFRSINVTMPVLQQAVRTTLERGESVWAAANFSSGNGYVIDDDDRFPRSCRGVMCVGAFDYPALVPDRVPDKRQRLRAGISPSNHAVTIVGYDPGKQRAAVCKWKIDNSWGKYSGDGGHFHMYDDFFCQYVERVVVPRSSLPEAVQRLLGPR